ncbi:pyruvate synthase subunit PorA [bacterium BMS3Abin07]|nr:pyruvate synthase subunit PorA [bacterium BMS3Abin07]GBE32658.1 pyruvate synthase subunit PorA [bacterium BMS3Bbin05]HDO23323.1 pyruvate ferredoxin oxidoreductase [Nitrospirota bacterium]HDZ87571.1 pyruvate ferredoxin oxidoreductase [Nitrospirota bacterium]
MGKLLAVTGNQAMAEAMRQINPDVCAAYPITPSTEVMQRFSSFVADGAVDTELVTVESEHSAMSACIGAAAAGGRVMTATSSQGLALMWEMLHIASGNRIPIVLTLVNRALSAPLNIHGDHSDSMGARDCGWIQIYSENGQEAYDNLIQAVRIAEHEDVRLPAMVCMDGFIISHSIESMEYLDDQVVRDFIGSFTPTYPLLDNDNPVTYGPLVLPDYFIEFKKAQHEATMAARDVTLEVAKDFAKISGRSYGLFEDYKLDDADIALVILNSAAGTAKDVVDEFRNKGIKAGILKPRLFRPFPYEEVGDALKNTKAVAVLDRSDSYGGFGPGYMEIASALMINSSRPILINKIYGLGGRDFFPEHAGAVLNELKEIAATGNVKTFKEYIGYRD